MFKNFYNAYELIVSDWNSGLCNCEFTNCYNIFDVIN